MTEDAAFHNVAYHYALNPQEIFSKSTITKSFTDLQIKNTYAFTDGTRVMIDYVTNKGEYVYIYSREPYITIIKHEEEKVERISPKTYEYLLPYKVFLEVSRKALQYEESNYSEAEEDGFCMGVVDENLSDYRLPERKLDYEQASSLLYKGMPIYEMLEKIVGFYYESGGSYYDIRVGNNIKIHVQIKYIIVDRENVVVNFFVEEIWVLQL